MRLGTILGNVAVVWALSAAANAGNPAVAQIVDFNMSTDAYAIVRVGAHPKVSYYQDLNRGDKILVKRADATIVIHYADQRTDIVTRAKSPYTVHTIAGGGFSLSRLVAELWQNATFEADTVRRSDLTRGATPTAKSAALALRIPGLADGSARIAAGPRHFVLQWVDGRRPYRVTVSGSAGETVVDERDIDGERLIVRSQAASFAPGRYDIRLVDAEGKIVYGSFTAVAAGIPAVQDFPDVPNAAEKSVLNGVLLSRDPTYAYEALLRLYDGLAAQARVAEDCATWIARGEK